HCLLLRLHTVLFTPTPPPPTATLLPYTTLFRSHTTQLRQHIIRADDSTFHTFYWDVETGAPLRGATEQGAHDDSCWARGQAWGVDRKSTRLNSSHVKISYAVFCLKKKKIKPEHK